MRKNIKQFLDNMIDLERIIETGYVDSSAMIKIDKFSRSVVANNTVTLLSSFNNLNPFLDTPTPLYIASSNINDTMSIRLQVINQARKMIDIDVVLTGTTPVALGTDIYCIWRMYNSSDTDYLGDISVTSNATGVPIDDSEVYCEMISINGIPNNQSLTGIFSIPAGWSGFLTHASIQVDKGADLKGAMFIRQQGGIFRFSKALTSYQSQSEYPNLFQRIPEKTDIKPYGYAQTGGISFVEYSLILINNEYLDNHIY